MFRRLMKKNKRSFSVAPNNSEWLIDFPRLFDSLEEWKKQYNSAAPFPHIVLEDLIDEDSLEKILAEFPGQSQEVRWHDRETYMEGGAAASLKKKDSADFLLLGPTIRQLIWELNSRPFLQFLQKLTGIPRLISDPLCYGGGVHETLKGGLLKVHADFQKHPIYRLDRRLNLILYLNRNWKESYGGHLELWNESLTQCATKVLPEAGRCVIFNTSRTSYHGHPRPLTCPEDKSRKSIALYYYTNGLDDEPRKPEGKTYWQETPVQ